MQETGSHPTLTAFQRLAQRKRALEGLVRITTDLERMHSGLQAVVLMGRPTGAVQQSALRYFGALHENTRILPTGKLQATVLRLESRVRDVLDRILGLAETFSGGNEPTPDADTTHLLDDFRRTAQTVVALRILLRERGVPSRPTELPVDPASLRARMAEVEQEENRCRDVVKTDIRRLQDEARAVLGYEGLPDGVRSATERMQAELQLNLAHLEAGGSIEALPHPIEFIEMDENAAPTATVVAKEPEPAPVEEAPPAPGFMPRLREWLNTPWSVTWRELSRRRNKRR